MRRRTPTGLLLGGVLAALLVFLPLASTLWDATQFDLAEAGEILFRPLVGRLLLNTLSITAAATLVCALVGTAAAWCVERTTLRFRRVWALLVAVPLAIPPFISSYAWLSISADLQDFAGALLVVCSVYYPLVFLPVSAALRGMDPALEESARALGLGPWACFTRVVLPQLRHAILGGMLLVALGVLSEFGAFVLLRFRTFTTEIYAEYRSSFDSSGAALLACVLIGLCVLCLLAEARVRGHARYHKPDRGTRRAALVYRLGWTRLPVLGGLALLVATALGVPLLAIGYWLTQTGADATTPVLATAALLWQATANSVQLGLAAALLTTALALPLAILLVRYPGRWSSLLERCVFLAQGLPGIVVALAVVSIGITVLQPLYQSTAMLVVSYAILFLPLALVNVHAAYAQVQPRLEEVARALGLSAWGTALRVVLPLAAPGLCAAGAMVFIAVVTELTATLMLSPIGTLTLATQMWSDTSTLAFAAAAPYAALLVGISLLATWALMSLLGNKNG
ncbi:iron ABC transporter permease [Rhodoferax sp.]|uniref:ABC transporter permease n=1 Tax=Rhodoferax sp. TaxID=50421 RepID=UPI0025E20C76|nr:iron ABC transporter permease [Rhodoferax sp.]